MVPPRCVRSDREASVDHAPDAAGAELADRREVPEVERVPWGYRILFLADPFGNELRFCEPFDPEQRAALPQWV